MACLLAVLTRCGVLLRVQEGFIAAKRSATDLLATYVWINEGAALTLARLSTLVAVELLAVACARALAPRVAAGACPGCPLLCAAVDCAPARCCVATRDRALCRQDA